jgi:transposase
VLATTDRVDARILAQIGEKLDLTPTVPGSPARVRLSDLLRRRRQLVEMRKAEKLRRQDAGGADILVEIDRMIRILDRRVETMDRTIADLIASDPGLERQAALLRAVPRIGPTVLAVLLGELPELGRLDRRRIASLAGLAPRARESGTWRGSRRIWGGRGRVR